MIANALDTWWIELGEPDPFYVYEVGAATGTLARSVINAQPRCSSALSYVMVEKSDASRNQQPIESPKLTNSHELPADQFIGVIIANELLDNIPVDIYELKNNTWHCVHVEFSNGKFVETVIPVSDNGVLQQLQSFDVTQSGSRIPLQSNTQQWLANSIQLLIKGKVVCFDYMHTTKWMSTRNWREWLRTYEGHLPGVSPFDRPGLQDITCEVAVDQLSQVKVPDSNRSQSEFLQAHGLSEFVSKARESWHSQSMIGNLGALEALSRVNESRALSDSTGLGSFRVLEWNV